MTRNDALKARRAELLTVKEFAVIVGQHEKSVYRRIAADTQPGVVRIGGSVRIDITAATPSTRK